MLSLVGQDEKGRSVAECSHCGKTMVFRMDKFDDVTKVVKSICPYCGGLLFSCVLVLTNDNLQVLIDQLNAVLGTGLERQRQYLDGPAGTTK